MSVLWLVVLGGPSGRNIKIFISGTESNWCPCVSNHQISEHHQCQDSVLRSWVVSWPKVCQSRWQAQKDAWVCCTYTTHHPNLCEARSCHENKHFWNGDGLVVKMIGCRYGAPYKDAQTHRHYSELEVRKNRMQQADARSQANHDQECQLQTHPRDGMNHE